MSFEPIRTRKCPICGNRTDLNYRPFCSKRCADIDLGRWLAGVYAVPVEDADDEDGEKDTEVSEEG